jgi:hypothetical protein
MGQICSGKFKTLDLVQTNNNYNPKIDTLIYKGNEYNRQ